MTARDALNCSTSRRSWDGEEQGLVLCELWVTSAREVPHHPVPSPSGIQIIMSQYYHFPMKRCY